MQRLKLKIQSLLIIIFLAVSFFSLLPNEALAVCEGGIVPCTTDCQFCHVFKLLDNILLFILTCLAPIIAGLMLVIGGFYFLAAGQNPESVATAKKIITATIVGLVIIFIAWVSLNTFMSTIGVATPGELEGIDLENWWNIECR
ncbi:MAG: pilin [Patescibacteria group bacterium]|nr:pilin [Patescibacteria group bacterium]